MTQFNDLMKIKQNLTENIMGKQSLGSTMSR